MIGLASWSSKRSRALTDHWDRNINADLPSVNLMLELARNCARLGEHGGAVAIGVAVCDLNCFVDRFCFAMLCVAVEQT